MGYTTDIIGHFTITPPLNAAEEEWLQAHAQTRHWWRPDGPYVVLDNPALPEEHDDSGTYSLTYPGTPGLWCGWTPCCEGACLAHDGIEKFYEPTAWLRYLIKHFLRDGAQAQTSGEPQFEDFTFDHVVSGAVAAHRRDTGRLWLIKVSNNRVREQTVVDGDPEESVYGPLPYQDRKDAASQRRGQRRARLRSV